MTSPQTVVSLWGVVLARKVREWWDSFNKDPDQLRASALPCGCLIMVITAILVAVLYPTLARMLTRGG